MLFFFFGFGFYQNIFFTFFRTSIKKTGARVGKNIKEWPCYKELLYTLKQQITLEELNIRIKQNSMKTARCIYKLQINLFLKIYWDLVVLQWYISFLLYSRIIQLYIQPLFFGFPAHLGHNRILSRVPCATQYVLLSYLLLYIIMCIC